MGLLVALGSAMLALVLLEYELRTSAFQSRYLFRAARQLTYHMAPGPSAAIHFPQVGPYDKRLGYTRLPDFVNSLRSNRYRVAAQARFSPQLLQLSRWGLSPTYEEKMQAGLRILDRHGEVMFDGSSPTRLYSRFEDIPELIVRTLLFIENRELLDPRYPRRNPAVEWDRLGQAVLDRMLRIVKPQHATAGGSTLATQLEKFRHSPGGRTATPAEKLRQMVSASLRAYHQGEKTLAVQRHIILSYLNALPLAAQTGYGEVHSLGDGLWAWYNADFAQINQVLAKPLLDQDPASLAAYATAYKHVLNLLVAHRRPSFYLRQHPEALAAHTDRYLHLASEAGLIAPAVRDAALHVQVQVRHVAPAQPQISFLERKAANVVRHTLMSQLGIPGLYPLDQLDLTVQSTLDRHVQTAVTDRFYKWRSAEAVRRAGLTGQQLLGGDADPAHVHYSLVLYEHAGQENRLRIHTDNLDQPFDVNQGTKLDLGSTAKLRTLLTYLEIVAALYDRYGNLSQQALRQVSEVPSDALTQWALDYLERVENKSLFRMLDAAMARRYTASPTERFFTGGGYHTFVNFHDRDNEKMISVQEAFHRSVNLVFIRIMRDIVNYYIARLPEVTDDRQNSAHRPQTNPEDLATQRLVQRYFDKYAGQSPATIVDALMASVHPTPQRFATLYGALEPRASLEMFTTFIRSRFPHPNLTPLLIQNLFERFVAAKRTWADRGQLTDMHPVELLTAAYLYRHPGASTQDLMKAHVEMQGPQQPSPNQGHDMSNRRRRIRLEKEAFQEIHKVWQRHGYPFGSLVPSYATAIGSSADRPDALADLMGMMVSNGVKYPLRHIQHLHFAANTPYETLLTPQDEVQQVLHPAIAAVVKEALFGVVEHGTAQHLQGAFKRPDGSRMRIGGKTGTGDHRYEVYGAHGQLLQSRVVNRAAALVFLIDDRFFGTITVYVPGSQAANYSFTSALPVRILKRLAPTLQPLLQASSTTDSASWPVMEAIKPQ